MANTALVLIGPALLLLALPSQVAYALQHNTTKLDVITPPSADSAPGNSSSGQTTQVSSNKQDSLTDGNTTVQGDSKGGPSSSSSGQVTSVVNLASAGFKPNSTKGLLSSGNLSPELLLGDQLGDDEPTCLPDVKKKTSECVDETKKKLDQTTDQEKRCDLLYNNLLCQIAAFCSCDYTYTKNRESGWQISWRTDHINCLQYFNKYPYLSKPYCNKTATNSGTATTQKENLVTTKSSLMPAKLITPSPECIKAEAEAKIRCLVKENSTEMKVVCRTNYDALLCYVDAICRKCSYAVVHAREALVKYEAKSTEPDCASYYKSYKFMSEDRCTLNGIATETSNHKVIIIAGSVVVVVGLLLALTIACCCCQRQKGKAAAQSGYSGGGKARSQMSGIPASKVDSKVSAIPSSKLGSTANSQLGGKSKIAGGSKLSYAGASKAKSRA